MKRPVFSQLDRLAEYEDHRRGRSGFERRYRRPLDELLRDDGRVVVEEGDDDAEP